MWLRSRSTPGHNELSSDCTFPETKENGSILPASRGRVNGEARQTDRQANSFVEEDHRDSARLKVFLPTGPWGRVDR